MTGGDPTCSPQGVPQVGGVCAGAPDTPYLPDDQLPDVDGPDEQEWPDPANQPQPQLAFVQAAPYEDIVVFEEESVRQATRSVPLDGLAVELADIVESRPVDGHTAYTFDVEIPGLGVLEGRLQIRSGLAELELRAQRSATATTLRERLTELKDMVDRESGGDVNLTIA